MLSFKLLLNSLQNKYISMSGSTGSRPGSTSSMVLGFYRFYGSTGPRVLQVLWFYRFYGSTGSRVLHVQVPEFYRFYDSTSSMHGSTGSRVLLALGFYRF